MFQFAKRNIKVFKVPAITERMKGLGENCVKNQEVDGQREISIRTES